MTTLSRTKRRTQVNAGAGGPTGSRRAWAITLLLLGFMLVNFGDRAVLGLAAAPLMKETGISPSQYGLISSGFYLLFSVSAIVVGFIANRVSNKVLILIMAIVWSLAQLPILFVANVGVLLASRVALGAAEGPSAPVAMNAVQKWFPDHKRNAPTALLNSGSALGVVILAPVLGVVIGQFGWRAAFGVMCALGVLWAALWAVFGREGTADRTPGPATIGETETGGLRVPYRRIFLTGTALSVVFSGLALSFGLATLVSWIPVYLAGPLGFDAGTAALLIILPWLASALLMSTQGAVSDALMSRGVPSRVARGVLGACGMLAAAACLVGVVAAPSLPFKIVCITLAFSVSGMQFTIGTTMMAELAPPRQRAAVLSIVAAVTALAGLVSPAITGVLVQAHGVASPTGFHQSFLLNAALLGAAGLVALLLARPARDAARIAAR